MFGVVFLLVIVDVVYLTVWQIVDPMRRKLLDISDQVKSVCRGQHGASDF